MSFCSLLAELKLAKLISDLGLNPEELVLVKQTFEEVRTLAKDDKLVAELEKAMADNDLAKVKILLGRKSKKAKELNINQEIHIIEKEKISNESINTTENLSSKIFNNTKKYFIDGWEVGSANISNNGYINFDINIPKKIQQQGYSTKIFEDAINHFNDQGKFINGIQ